MRNDNLSILTCYAPLMKPYLELKNIPCEIKEKDHLYVEKVLEDDNLASLAEIFMCSVLHHISVNECEEFSWSVVDIYNAYASALESEDAELRDMFLFVHEKCHDGIFKYMSNDNDVLHFNQFVYFNLCDIEAELYYLVDYLVDQVLTSTGKTLMIYRVNDSIVVEDDQQRESLPDYINGWVKNSGLDKNDKPLKSSNWAAVFVELMKDKNIKKIQCSYDCVETATEITEECARTNVTVRVEIGHIRD